MMATPGGWSLAHRSLRGRGGGSEDGRRKGKRKGGGVL